MCFHHTPHSKQPKQILLCLFFFLHPGPLAIVSCKIDSMCFHKLSSKKHPALAFKLPHPLFQASKCLSLFLKHSINQHILLKTLLQWLPNPLRIKFKLLAQASLHNLPCPPLNHSLLMYPTTSLFVDLRMDKPVLLQLQGPCTSETLPRTFHPGLA